jgi:hypothetical protein
LLSIYQGSLNDNVMKLVNFKRAIDTLEGRKVVLIGAAAFAESLYPHVGFRPVLDIRVLVPPHEVEPFARYLKRIELTPTEAPVDLAPAERVLSDGRTLVFVHGRLTDQPAVDREVLERTLPMPVYGPSAFRLTLEDALLAHVLLISRAHFEVPMLEWIDLRELMLGAPATGGAWTRPLEVATVVARAKQWKMERALFAAISIVARLFPETFELARQLEPALSWPVKELISRLLVGPVSQVGRDRVFKLEQAVFEALAGA